MKIFLDYFEAFKKKKDHLKSNDEDINNLEFNLISYNETIENLEKDRNVKKILIEENFLCKNPEVNFYFLK